MQDLVTSKILKLKNDLTRVTFKTNVQRQTKKHYSTM